MWLPKSLERELPVSSSHPLDVFASKPAVRLLRYLVTHPEAVTGRQLARAAGVHHSVAQQALERPTREGVLERRRVGTANLYSLNQNHYIIAEILRPAFLSEAGWLNRLGEEILDAFRPAAASVILYGSWARGTTTPRSDIDVLVVAMDAAGREALEHRADEVRGRLSERFARSVSLLVLTAEEIRKRLRKGDRLVRAIASEGRVLGGRSLAEIASGE